jgi:hypothetical protein
MNAEGWLMSKIRISDKAADSITNFCVNIVYFAAIIGILYAAAPVHELFHFLPCKLTGLSPEMSYFGVNCDGIAEKSTIVQFVYFMGPYLFYTSLLLFLFFNAKKHAFLRYLIPLPMFDMMINYISALGGDGDFIFLIGNTGKATFVIAMLLVVSMVFLTWLSYVKYRIYSFEGIVKKLNRRR